MNDTFFADIYTGRTVTILLLMTHVWGEEKFYGADNGNCMFYTPKPVPNATPTLKMTQISSFLAMWRADDAANRTRPPNDFAYRACNFV